MVFLGGSEQINSHIIQKAFQPVRYNFIKEFDKYGPDFEIALEFTLEATPGAWKEIFVLSTGKDTGELGVRYPQLAVVDHGEPVTKREFGLQFYYDPDEHYESGESLRYEGVELNKRYQMTITHKNKILTWTINGEEVATLVNTNPMVHSKMKLFMSNTNHPLPGTISYFSLSAESK